MFVTDHVRNSVDRCDILHQPMVSRQRVQNVAGTPRFPRPAWGPMPRARGMMLVMKLPVDLLVDAVPRRAVGNADRAQRPGVRSPPMAPNCQWRRRPEQAGSRDRAELP